MKRITFVFGLLLWIGVAAGTSAQGNFRAGETAYSRGDYATAMREMLPLAQQGAAEAQFYIGYMHRNGQGVQPDYAEAAKWYRLSAAQGYGAAQFNLGLMYDNGHGVPQDHTEAARWYQLAAEQGIAGAQLNLGMKYRDGLGVLPDLVRAHFWMNLATVTAPPDGALQYMAVNERSIVARRLSAVQLKRAEEMAKAWWAKNPR